MFCFRAREILRGGLFKFFLSLQIRRLYSLYYKRRIYAIIVYTRRSLSFTPFTFVAVNAGFRMCFALFFSLIKNSKSYRTAALLIVPATFVAVAVLLFRGLNAADQRGLEILLQIQWESLLKLDVRVCLSVSRNSPSPGRLYRARMRFELRKSRFRPSSPFPVCTTDPGGAIYLPSNLRTTTMGPFCRTRIQNAKPNRRRFLVPGSLYRKKTPA